jgi:hypothetical protein
MTTVSTRRAFLKSAPVALVSSAILPASAYAATSGAADVNVAPMTANPALIEAHGRLKAALAEREEAKDALEWLADEWRHLWPLAPEELLRGANADRYGSRDTAERDIIGNFIYRDASALTMRLSREFRAANARTCFHVETSADAQETLDAWTAREPTGRTEKALARNRALREECIQEYSHKVALAREYEAETERLRNAAGVSKAQERIQIAERLVSSAYRDISVIPATNLKDMVIKGEALMNDGLVEACKSQTGILGDMIRFIKNTVDLGGAA